jgi:hypothetical protein
MIGTYIHTYILGGADWSPTGLPHRDIPQRTLFNHFRVNGKSPSKPHDEVFSTYCIWNDLFKYESNLIRHFYVETIWPNKDTYAYYVFIYLYALLLTVKRSAFSWYT